MLPPRRPLGRPLHGRIVVGRPAHTTGCGADTTLLLRPHDTNPYHARPLVRQCNLLILNPLCSDASEGHPRWGEALPRPLPGSLAEPLPRPSASSPARSLPSPLVKPLVRSLSRSSARSLLRPLPRSPAMAFPRSLAETPARSLPSSSARSLVRPFPRPLVEPLAQPLAEPLPAAALTRTQPLKAVVPARWLDFPSCCHILRLNGTRPRRRQTSG